MMRGFAEDFKKMPDVVSGKFAANITTGSAMKVIEPFAEKMKTEKPKQAGLF